MSIYFDNSATTRPLPQVVDAMVKAMTDGFYNPSAAYSPAFHAEKEIKLARERIASHLGIHHDGVVFTSCGTEADQLAIYGLLGSIHHPGKILYSSVEHPAIKNNCIEAARRFGTKAEEIPVTMEGYVDLEKLEQMLSQDTSLICVMQVNNESGAIQPLEQISRMRDRICPQAFLHVDGVQGFLRVPINLKKTGIATYALSAHKIGGPKGAGALAIADGIRVRPQLLGGGQENGMRSGTENTPGIAGLSAAVEGYQAYEKGNESMRRVKFALLNALADLPIHVNGPLPEEAAAHILNISLPPVRSETMLHALEGAGIYVSMGSACAAHKQKISTVLQSMNVEKKYAESALRFSFCPDNTVEEALQAAMVIHTQYELLKKYQRR